MGKFQRNKLKLQAVVCNFLGFKDKHKVLQNATKLKKTRIFIYEHFSKAAMELRKCLRDGVLQYQQQNNSIFKLQKHCCQRHLIR